MATLGCLASFATAKAGPRNPMLRAHMGFGAFSSNTDVGPAKSSLILFSGNWLDSNNLTTVISKLAIYSKVGWLEGSVLTIFRTRYSLDRRLLARTG